MDRVPTVYHPRVISNELIYSVSANPTESTGSLTNSFTLSILGVGQGVVLVYPKTIFKSKRAR